MSSSGKAFRQYRTMILFALEGPAIAGFVSNFEPVSIRGSYGA
ncbi:MAG TPA: hypothetical protein VIS99_17940 [Terrimicrobiaceae bacterium]